MKIPHILKFSLFWNLWGRSPPPPPRHAAPESLKKTPNVNVKFTYLHGDILPGKFLKIEQAIEKSSCKSEIFLFHIVRPLTQLPCLGIERALFSQYKVKFYNLSVECKSLLLTTSAHRARPHITWPILEVTTILHSSVSPQFHAFLSPFTFSSIGLTIELLFLTLKVIK